MPKMGRPPKPTSEAILTERLTILVTRDDRAWLERQAATLNLSVAAYIRELVDTARREDDR